MKSSPMRTLTFTGLIPRRGNRRAARRLPCLADVFLRPLAPDLPSRWVSSDDITDKGLFIRTGACYPPETLLRLHIHTPRGRIKITGQVVHHLDAYGFGCRFIDIERGDLRRLERFLADCAAGPSRPPAGFQALSGPL